MASRAPAGGAVPGDPRGLRVARWLAVVVAGLMGGAAVAGLAVQGVYRDNLLVAAGWRGNDVVTLGVAVPALLVAWWRSRRGSVPGTLILLGILLYAGYGYAFYLFGAAFNALFLVYAGIVTAAGFGLAFGVAALDAGAVAAGFRPGAPARPVAVFILGVAVGLGLFWILTSAAFLLTGRPPPMVEATGHPTNVTGALDLGLVVALGALAGSWLWRGRPWGWIWAVIWCVKGAVYMLALSAAAVAGWVAGPGDPIQLALWLPIGVGCGVAAVALLRGYGWGRGRGTDGGGRPLG